MKSKLSDEIFEKLKNDIIFNIKVPGEKVGELELCERFNASRTPVRQALQQLENLGLIEIRDGVGSFVTLIHEDDLRDAYRIRCMAEKEASKIAIDKIPLEVLDNLQRRFEFTKNQLEKGGYDLSFKEMVMLDWELHDLIINNSGNRLLKDTIEAITMLLRRCQFAYISQYERATNDHLEIIRCLKEKDEEGLGRILDAHLRFRPN